MKKISQPIFAIVLSAGLMYANLAHALDNPYPGLFVSFSDNSASGLTFEIIKALLGLVGILATFFIVWGGLRYITSAGNDELAASGKKTMTNAIIGLIIVILSYAIIVGIINTVSVSS